ncbi:transcription factor bHLH144-like [Cynara cardunculus var. scolymus]|uniref:transcription factor bHLH144-like n=1 Tax=Cynara cardunculus var. scolymus TaxID=59895 RepID=UPI000D62F7C3|nr:transcription factor bHLH144-like [Cynara cardunculus var. scolymus]XP_024961808.1 transcription factor bHLH144-like [Cynara cardunculus var. scolymus]
MQGDQAGSGYLPDPHISSFFVQSVDFRPSRDCPRNFIIFDRTDKRSQIMYNPTTASNFGYFPDSTTLVQKDVNAPRVMNEDSADIDALLSFEDEEEEEEEVSTGRTGRSDTSDTCDSWCSRSRNGGPGLLSGHGSKGSEEKREKMRKMVKSIRGIVPDGGGNEMNTVAILDEAVKYLKSLKVEAQKIGLGYL